MPLDPSLAEDAVAGAPVHKFSEVGDVCRLEITDWRRVQDKDFATGELKTWPDGNPVWTYHITGIAPTGDEERIVARGQLFKLLRDTVVPELLKVGEAAGTLSVKFDHTEPASTKGFNDKKVFVAKYEPPKAPTLSADDF